MKKGQQLQFKDRTEIILKGSSNRLTGLVTTDRNVYSVDFLYRWIDFNFVKLV